MLLFRLQKHPEFCVWFSKGMFCVFLIKTLAKLIFLDSNHYVEDLDTWYLNITLTYEKKLLYCHNVYMAIQFTKIECYLLFKYHYFEYAFNLTYHFVQHSKYLEYVIKQIRWNIRQDCHQYHLKHLKWLFEISLISLY